MASTRLHPLGFRREGTPFVSYLQIKRSEVPGRQEQTEAGLFVCGLPISFQEADLFQLFSCFGDVHQAVLHPSKRSGIVLFGSSAAVDACISAARQAQMVELPAIQSSEQPEDSPCGLKAWVVAHKAARPGTKQLQTQLDAWTEAHEAAEAERLRAQQAAMGEDGWTVVVRTKGRKRTREEGGVTSQSGGVALAAAQALAATRQHVPLENFYNFQRREKRRNELVDLRERFNEDRKRIQSLRAVRNFKPV